MSENRKKINKFGKILASVILAALTIIQSNAMGNTEETTCKPGYSESCFSAELKKIADNKGKIATAVATTAASAVILNRIFNKYHETLPTTDGTDVLSREFQIHILDVGRADCILIRYGKWTCLVDGGNVDFFRNTDVVKYLNSLGINTLNVLILTHPHFDHFGQMDEIIEKLGIENFICSESGTNFLNSWGYEKKVTKPLKKKGIFGININAGDYIFNSDEFKIQVIGPTKRHNDINDNSVVLLLTYQGKKILLMGDAGVESEREIMEYCRANGIDISNVDAMKIGHHGYFSSSSKEFVNFVRPKVALNSTGKQNIMTFNLLNLHECPWIMKRYKDVGSEILTTEEQGTMVLSLNNSGHLEFHRRNIS